MQVRLGNTGGRLCEPWCRIVERHGLWTLLATIGLPIGATKEELEGAMEGHVLAKGELMGTYRR